MTQTLITALNGKARPKNPQQGSTDCKYRPAPCCSDCECDHWDKFESTVKWHDCPEATEDGEYTAELVWQMKLNDQWYLSVEPTADAGSRYRQVWRIVPQPQEPSDRVKKLHAMSVPMKEGDRFYRENEEAKTVEGKTAEDILFDISEGHNALVDNVIYIPEPDVIEAMQAYSSQQNTALMEENSKYKRALEHVRVFSAEEIIRNIATEALKPKQSSP